MSSPQVLLVDWIDAFGTGGYLLVALIHLELWLRRRERSAHFWLALSSGGALLMTLTALVLRRTAPEPSALLQAINVAALALTIITVFELVVCIGRRRPGPVTRGLEIGIVTLAAANALPSGDPNSPLFSIVIFVLLGAGLSRAHTEGQNGDRDSTTAGRGLLALTLAIAIERLAALSLIPLIPGVTVLGFSVFFVAATRALNERYDREQRDLVAVRQELEARVAAQEAELEQAYDKLLEASRTDPLTGLPNRRAFLEAVERETVRCQRSGRLYSIVMIDLDHFKQINETYGHAAGDAVLRTASEALRRSLRAQDIVARWGGEEFIALLPETFLEGAIHAAEALRLAIAAERVEFGRNSIAMAASFGVAEHKSYLTVSATISAADSALFRAKERVGTASSPLRELSVISYQAHLPDNR